MARNHVKKIGWSLKGSSWVKIPHEPCKHPRVFRLWDIWFFHEHHGFLQLRCILHNGSRMRVSIWYQISSEVVQLTAMGLGPLIYQSIPQHWWMIHSKNFSGNFEVNIPQNRSLKWFMPDRDTPPNLVILFGHRGSLCNMMLQVVPWALIANEFQFERTERINTKHCRIFYTLYKGCVDCEFFPTCQVRVVRFYVSLFSSFFFFFSFFSFVVLLN